MAAADLIECVAVPQTKLCKVCGDMKPLEDFYRHPDCADGRAHLCKECHKTRMTVRRKTNPEVQAYDRERAKLPHRREKAREITARWRSDNPNGYKAHNAINNAIRDGKIAREPCGLCGSDEHVHAHHRDYSRPLDVIWLCARCHHRIHALFPELEGANKRGGA